MKTSFSSSVKKNSVKKRDENTRVERRGEDLKASEIRQDKLPLTRGLKEKRSTKNTSE